VPIESEWPARTFLCPVSVQNTDTNRGTGAGKSSMVVRRSSQSVQTAISADAANNRPYCSTYSRRTNRPFHRRCCSRSSGSSDWRSMKDQVNIEQRKRPPIFVSCRTLGATHLQLQRNRSSLAPAAPHQKPAHGSSFQSPWRTRGSCARHVPDRRRTTPPKQPRLGWGTGR
jgi:hypothetical protein